MATPAIQTARLRALRGAEDPSLSVRMRNAQRTQGATPQSPMQYPQQGTQQGTRQRLQTAPTQRIPTQPTPQQSQPQNEIVAQALQNGAINTVRQKAIELARLRAERDFEQGLSQNVI